MMEQQIDQTVLAEDVSKRIKYDPIHAFLVKPLDPIMVDKEITRPIAKKDEATKDDNGVEAIDYESTETKIESVESDYREAIVLKVPFDVQDWYSGVNGIKKPVYEIKVGDTIVYRHRSGMWFDLCKDTQFVTHYDIVAIKNRD